MITAATARRDYLEPAMDARGANLEQAHLLSNETPAVDSVVECIDLVRSHPDLVDHPVVAHLTDLVERLILSNEAEGDFERQIAGAADVLVRDLRNTELNGVSKAVTAKGLARQLREHLRVIADATAATCDERLDAFAAVHHAATHYPTSQLLSPAVQHELGRGKFDVLERLVRTEATV